MKVSFCPTFFDSLSGPVSAKKKFHKILGYPFGETKLGNLCGEVVRGDK